MLAHISTDGSPAGLFFIWLYSDPFTANEERYIRVYFDFNEREHAAKFLRDYKVTSVEFSSKMSPKDRQFLGWLERVTEQRWDAHLFRQGRRPNRVGDE